MNSREYQDNLNHWAGLCSLPFYLGFLWAILYMFSPVIADIVGKTAIGLFLVWWVGGFALKAWWVWRKVR